MDKNNILKAIDALKNGEIIVYPTDTLYGLGSDIFNQNAVRKIFKIKNRSITQPLSIAVSDLNELNNIAYITDVTEKLVKNFLPGKITLIVDKKKIIPDIITAGSKKVAVRIPDNKIALKLLSEFGPVTATSANIHGKETPKNINLINKQFKEKISVYLDDGELIGNPSTIIDVTEEKIDIIRQGAIPKSDIMELIQNG